MRQKTLGLLRGRVREEHLPIIMADLGVPLPKPLLPAGAGKTTLSAAASARKAGFKFELAKIDAALDEQDLSTTDRMAVKSALHHYGLLQA